MIRWWRENCAWAQAVGPHEPATASSSPFERHYDVQANTRSRFNHLWERRRRAWSQSTDLLLQFLSQFVEGGSLAGVLLPACPHQGVNSRGAVFWSLHAITCVHSLLHLPERLQEQKEQIAKELWGCADWNFRASVWNLVATGCEERNSNKTNTNICPKSENLQQERYFHSRNKCFRCRRLVFYVTINTLNLDLLHSNQKHVHAYYAIY